MDKKNQITVIYFSPTGGTRKACLNLAWSMGNKVRDMDLCGVEEEISFGPEDTVIVGMPVFGGRIPAFGREKLSLLKGKGAAAVAVAVYGNRAFEEALLELSDCLKEQGFVTAAGAALLAEHSMARSVAAGRPDSQDEKETRQFGKRILEKLSSDEVLEAELPGNRPYRDWKPMPVTPLTNGSCISCGLCAARCPVKAIPVNDPASTDADKCILCMRCISVCPVHARSLPEQAAAMLEQKLAPVREIRRDNELFL